MTKPTPHGDKLKAALANPKASADVAVLAEAEQAYKRWLAGMGALNTTGQDRVREMVGLLNAYKDTLEVDLIMRRGSSFLKRQKGQLKLDGSVMEEFLIHLVRPEIIKAVEGLSVVTGPQNAFLSLSFHPRNLQGLSERPEVSIKSKDQDFVLGSEIHYRFSTDPSFATGKVEEGSFVLAVVAAECKVNLDKTMFQEAAGTAGRLKQGCPIARYFVLVEYLDMTPEDCRLTAIDNVFLLRQAARLPFEKRSKVEEVERQHRDYPINHEVVWRFVEQINEFLSAVWYDPEGALKRGSFN